jgi:RHS repeat-associated protein
VNLPDGRTISYVHDPLGRRIAKKVNGAITEKYLWSGLTTLLAVYDGSDNLVMRFRYADGRMPVAVEKSGATYYLAYDQVGTLRAVADSSGNVVKEISYDSFGFVINDTNPGFGIPFGFAGGLYDRDTGLVRFGYRDYDPDTGRWTAKDPIGFAGGDSDLYGYCINDPVNWIDPWGLFEHAGGFVKTNGKWHAASTTTEGSNDSGEYHVIYSYYDESSNTKYSWNEIFNTSDTSKPPYFSEEIQPFSDVPPLFDNKPFVTNPEDYVPGVNILEEALCN